LPTTREFGRASLRLSGDALARRRTGYAGIHPRRESRAQCSTDEQPYWLGLDASPKLPIQTFNGVGRPSTLPLARRKPCNREKSIACFFKADRNGAVPQAPFAHYGRAWARAREILCALCNAALAHCFASPPTSHQRLSRARPRGTFSVPRHFGGLAYMQKGARVGAVELMTIECEPARASIAMAGRESLLFSGRVGVPTGPSRPALRTFARYFTIDPP
jgi:hypothetical protein